MKHYFLLAIFLNVFSTKFNAQCTSTDLIISQYLEGSSYNKCIELYNGTGTAITFDDMDYDYEIYIYFDGNTSKVLRADLVGTISDKETFVICALNEALGISRDQNFSNNFVYNGDDVVALTKSNGTILVDIFGQIGYDPGDEWSSNGCKTKDQTLSRNLMVTTCNPDNNGSDAFDPYVWAGNGVGCAAIDNIDGLGSTAPLPVELIDFKIKKLEKRIQLTWTTVSELNNAYFSIERSTNGTTFSEIGKVMGHGTTTTPQFYTFTDENPRKGINYYRLRQVDFDGQFEYSEVIHFKFEQAQTMLTIYPNPTKTTLYVDFPNEHQEQINIQIIDMLGQVLKNTQIKHQGQLALWVEDLVGGTYLLQVKYNNTIIRKQFLKIK